MHFSCCGHGLYQYPVTAPKVCERSLTPQAGAETVLSAAITDVIWNAARSSIPMEKIFMLAYWKRAFGVNP